VFLLCTLPVCGVGVDMAEGGAQEVTEGGDGVSGEKIETEEGVEEISEDATVEDEQLMGRRTIRGSKKRVNPTPAPRLILGRSGNSPTPTDRNRSGTVRRLRLPGIQTLRIHLVIFFEYLYLSLLYQCMR